LPEGPETVSGTAQRVYGDVLTSERLAERRQIQLGARSLGAVEIVAGLNPGEEIVISNLDPFRGAETVLLTD